MELPEELRVPGLYDLNLFAEAITFRQISRTVKSLDEVTVLEIDEPSQLDELHELSNLSQLSLYGMYFDEIKELWSKIPDGITALHIHRCELGKTKVLPKKALKNLSVNVSPGSDTSMSIAGHLESIEIHVHEDDKPFQLEIGSCEILVLILEGDIVVTGVEAKKIYVYQANPFREESTYELKLEKQGTLTVMDGRGFF